jgi:hypothetical protein
MSKAAVTKYLGLSAAAGLDWVSVQEIDEAALERRLLVAPERPRDHAKVQGMYNTERDSAMMAVRDLLPGHREIPYWLKRAKLFQPCIIAARTA